MTKEALRLIELATQTARQAAECGAAVACRYLEHDLQPSIKDDASPVTLADREAERAIIQLIQTGFPSHSILGEETGFIQGDSSARWIIDPIDGTRGFIRGGSCWGTLVGFELEGEIVAGAICLPMRAATYWAGRGRGTYRGEHRLHLAPTASLRTATLSLGEMQHLFRPPYQETFLQLLQDCASSRSFGDPGGLAMVLEGQADLWIEGGVKPWDLAPAKILIEEAGGRFTNFIGGTSLEPGQALAGNKDIHEIVLQRLIASAGSR